MDHHKCVHKCVRPIRIRWPGMRGTCVLFCASLPQSRHFHPSPGGPTRLWASRPHPGPACRPLSHLIPPSLPACLLVEGAQIATHTFPGPIECACTGQSGTNSRAHTVTRRDSISRTTVAMTSKISNISSSPMMWCVCLWCRICRILYLQMQSIVRILGQGLLQNVAPPPPPEALPLSLPVHLLSLSAAPPLSSSSSFLLSPVSSIPVPPSPSLPQGIDSMT